MVCQLPGLSIHGQAPPSAHAATSAMQAASAMQLSVQVMRYLATRRAQQQQESWKLPAVHHAPGFLRYSHASAGTHAHEAGCAHMLSTSVSRLRQGLVS